VAVLDTGIRSSHEFFSAKTIVEACFSALGDCPNGLTEMHGPGAATHYENTYRGWDHGTHVTGIAAGNKENALYGVAKDADIIAIQVFSRFTAEECDGSPCIMSYTSDQIKGLEYLYTLRGIYSIASANMSLGGGRYSNQTTCDRENASTKSAIDHLRSIGIATVIASGNDGFCDGLNAPGCISSAVAIGATTKSDQQTRFSNWHESMLDLFAPGQSIFSSTGDSDTSYEYWSGTSMAAPHVAGAWAILKQKNPSETVPGILNSLSTTGVPVTTLCTKQLGSKPRIKVDATLAALSCDNPPLKVDTQYFNTVQVAYDSAPEGSIIQVQSVGFTEDLIFDRNITATFKGGYDCDYTANPGYTIVNGSLKISNGMLMIENLAIK
jgi:subtilisin family serine protease